MIKKYFLLAISLSISLFIYLFYRTEKTAVNEICISIFSLNSFNALRHTVTNHLPLNPYIIYSLPEGLWIFCIALTSKNLFIKINNINISLLLAPLILAIGLEVLQLFHITNGRFDFLDIFTAVLFWCIANFLIPNNTPKQYLFKPLNTRSIVCLVSYCIVYLAHVFK